MVRTVRRTRRGAGGTTLLPAGYRFGVWTART